MNQKKKAERNDLNWLKTHHSLFDLDWQDEEPPDFLAHIGGKKVGLEITQYTGLHEETEKENLISKVRSICIEKLESFPKPPGKVEVWCDYSKWPKVHNSNSISDEIVKLIIDSFSGEAFEIPMSQLPDSLKSCGITKISISKHYEIRPGTNWTFPQFGYLKKLTSEDLQKIIDKKNRSRAAYAENFDETWLVIISQKFGASSFYQPVNGPLRVKFDFDRAFIFDNSTTQLLELEQFKD